MCEEGEELATCLFLHYEMECKIWFKVTRWLEFNLITPFILFVHLECYSDEMRTIRTLENVFD